MGRGGGVYGREPAPGLMGQWLAMSTVGGGTENSPKVNSQCDRPAERAYTCTSTTSRTIFVRQRAHQPWPPPAQWQREAI